VLWWSNRWGGNYILFWRTINILSTASWQDRAAAVRGYRTERFRRSFVPTVIRFFKSDCWHVLLTFIYLINWLNNSFKLRDNLNFHHGGWIKYFLFYSMYLLCPGPSNHGDNPFVNLESRISNESVKDWYSSNWLLSSVQLLRNLSGGDKGVRGLYCCDYGKAYLFN